MFKLKLNVQKIITLIYINSIVRAKQLMREWLICATATFPSHPPLRPLIM
jgi:hypothetical protein